MKEYNLLKNSIQLVFKNDIKQFGENNKIQLKNISGVYYLYSYKNGYLISSPDLSRYNEYTIFRIMYTGAHYGSGEIIISADDGNEESIIYIFS